MEISSSSVEISSSDDKNTLNDSPVSSYEPQKPVQVRLVDEANLWSEFSKLGTEMIVNKIGRQMFPGVKLIFENLNPYKFYKVYMEIAPVDGMRYKFDRNGWSPKGTIETSIMSSWIEHPLSPAEGFKWMMKPVDFNVRLTNSLENHTDEKVFLRSMFKYRVIIHLEEKSDAIHINPQMTHSFPLLKTTFVAVTTYQNHEVKDLKTATNIHAKGIRQKKLKQFQQADQNMKENVGKRSITEITDPSKRPRIEPPCSSTDFSRFFPSRESYDAGKFSTNSSLFRSNFCSSPMRYMKPNDSYAPPILTHYRRFETPILSEPRTPVTAPLSVYCPPYSPLDHPPFYTPLLMSMPPPNFPRIPPYSPPSFYPSSWSMYQNNCIANTCRSSTLNICPSCQDGYQSCLSCPSSLSSQTYDHMVPSSTTEAEISSSYVNSATFPVSSRSSDSTTSQISDENPSNHSNASDNISSSVVEALNHVFS